MAERIYWHIGLPKTGTTYLQKILWNNREELERSGISLPAAGHRRSLWAALDLMGNTRLDRRHPDAPGSWERLCQELDSVEGTALLTHEFFCGATAQQVERAVARLAPAEIHVVITARDAAGMLTAGWQEHVKNGGVSTLREVAELAEPAEFGWWVWDLGQVVERWAGAVPAGRIHVLPMPERSEGPDQHWRNFAKVIGSDAVIEGAEAEANRSLGVVQAEALRRVNQKLRGFGRPVDRGVWIRGYLGEDHLARQHSERVRLEDDLLRDCRERSERAADLIERLGIQVVGSPDRLLVAPGEPSGRTLESVGADEVADALAGLVSTLVADVREERAANARSAAGTAPEPEARGVRRIRERVQSVISSARTDHQSSS
ncbi:hypothetical protein ncot_14385 [Nocardioides sp. JQ2195]|uniref:hypothetical protein n=1 Tax=Nocardioides sp. JQ2195 TaxID=2592334 RepID=UPI00143EA7AB|nr:hypothetical protein [Nocardioides sp. JQ2195]QIX27651.1 hypothetical protein ncot_14385 [Nocardioides sp. JQ2195]